MSKGTATVTPCDAEGTWLISLHGDHDLETRLQLQEQTNAILPFCKVVVIDLSDVGFIDSGVIRWLFDLDERLEAACAFTLSIVEGRPGSTAARVFQLLRVRHVLACYPSRERALDQVPAGIGRLGWRPVKRQTPRSGAGLRQAA